MQKSILQTTLLDFVDTWNRLSKNINAYKLDYTWPSVAILDLILMPIASRQNLSAVDTAMINGAALYLTGIAEHCWHQYEEKPRCEYLFPDASQASLTLQAFDRKDVLLFEIDLSKTLLAIIRNESKPFVFFPFTQRQPTADTSRIQLFAYGLALGMSPFASGKWNADTAKLDDKKRAAVDATLCASSALHYQSRFPSEGTGAKPLLYKDGLSFPPAGHLEPFPYSRALLSINNYIQTNNLSDDDINALAKNFSRTADDILSTVGISLLIVLNENQPDRSLKLLCESKGIALAALNPALSILREARSGFGHWASVAFAAKKTLSPELNEIASTMLQRDYMLGLMPALRLSPEPSTMVKYFDLCNALLWGNLDNAIVAIDKIASSEWLSDELLIQKAHIYALLEKPTQALDALQYCTNAKSAKYKEAYAMAQQQIHDFSIAELFYQAALDSEDCDTPTLRNVANRILTGIFSQGDFDHCLDLATSLRSREDLLCAEIFRTESLHLTGQSETAKESLQNLILHVPYNRFVFSLSLRLLKNFQ